MLNPKEQLSKLARIVRRTPAVKLPEDDEAAAKKLVSLVCQNNYSLVSELLDGSKFDINCTFGDARRTLALVAAEAGSVRCLSKFLSLGADPNYQDGTGTTALLYAARKGSRDCIVKLLECKADPAIRDNNSWSLLHSLAAAGRDESIVEFKEHFKNLDDRTNHVQTALHLACQNSFSATIHCLVELGASVNVIDRDGSTPLHLACHGLCENVSALLEFGALHVENVCGETPMTLCLKRGYGVALNLLLHKFPRLCGSVVPAALKLMKDEPSSVIISLRHLCTVRDKSATLQLISKFAENSGSQLLNTSSDFDSCANAFKSAVDLLSELDENGDPAVFQPLECLWKSLQEWMVLLKEDIDEIDEKNVQSNGTSRVDQDTVSTVSSLPFDDTNPVGSSSTEPNFAERNDEPNGTSRVDQDTISGVSSLPFDDTDPVGSSSTEPNYDEKNVQPDGTSRVGEDTCSAVSSLSLDDTSPVGSSFTEPNSGASKVDQCSDSSIPVDCTDSVHSSSTDTEPESSLESDPPSSVSNVEESQSSNDTRGVPLEMCKRIRAVIEEFFRCTQCLNTVQSRFEEFIRTHDIAVKYLFEKINMIDLKHCNFLINCPHMLSQLLHVVKKCPFDERYNWFLDNLKRNRLSEARVRYFGRPQTLMISRDNLFQDSFEALQEQHADILKAGVIIKFKNEKAVGKGVVHEWFDVLSNELCKPDHGLFTESCVGGTFQPNSNSGVDSHRLFRTAGKFIGLAVYHKELVNVRFTTLFYKHILGIPLDYKDLVSVDPEYAGRLQWTLDNDITDLNLNLTFSTQTEDFKTISLKPDGDNIAVTEENKEEYVQLLTEFKMTRSLKSQIDAFREGFNAFIPQSFLQIFSVKEFELLLVGKSDIDVQDLKEKATYSGCTKNHQF